MPEQHATSPTTGTNPELRKESAGPAAEEVKLPNTEKAPGDESRPERSKPYVFQGG